MSDGITHINIYSKASTTLGRMLSNFSSYPINTEDGKFNSIEGYWFWLASNDDKLRDMVGSEAKKYGTQVRPANWVRTMEFENKIVKAVKLKIDTYSEIKEEFIKSELPFTHYYVWNNTTVDATNTCKFLIDFISSYRNELKMEKLLS